MKLFSYLLFTIFNFSSLRIHAFVDIDTGQLFHQMVDFELDDGRLPLIISRQYQQSKPGKSLLGDRWCFDFEQQMRLENGGYRLNSCGNPTTVFFKLSGKKMTFESEKMFEMKNGGLLRRTAKNTTLYYDDKGRLIGKSRSGTKQYTIKYFYDRENNLQAISYKDKYLLQVQRDASDKIAGFISNGKKIVSYSVVNKKLVGEKNGWGLQHEFQYDDHGLLAKIIYPGKTSEKFSYSQQTKLIKGFTNKKGCERKFSYQLDTAKSTAGLTIQDACIKQPPLKITLRRSSIFYKNRAEKARQQRESKKPKTLAVKRDRFNRVSKIETPAGNWTINYNSQNGRLSTITENAKNSKLPKTYQVFFRYNKIIEISEPGKTKINYVYSASGKLLRIKSNARPAEKVDLIAKIDQIRSIVEDSAL